MKMVREFYKLQKYIFARYDGLCVTVLRICHKRCKTCYSYSRKALSPSWDLGGVAANPLQLLHGAIPQTKTTVIQLLGTHLQCSTHRRPNLTTHLPSADQAEASESPTCSASQLR